MERKKKMNKAYSREDIETHSEHYGKARPAVNVKVYRFPGLYKIMDKFECEEAEASRAGEYAFESACELFWNECAQDVADDVFGDERVKVYSEGRSGGWLVVDGLSSVESWDLMMINKWHSFETKIKKEIAFRTSEEMIFEDIAANEWCKPMAEKYNFYQKENGENVCIADMKAEAIAKGYAPIVRK
jgi:hypothetical protein